MDIETVRAVFGWMSLINMGILIFAAVLFRLAGDFVFEVRSNIFPMDREFFDRVTYTGVTGYKILWIVFNVVPYFALTLVA